MMTTNVPWREHLPDEAPCSASRDPFTSLVSISLLDVIHSLFLLLLLLLFKELLQIHFILDLLSVIVKFRIQFEISRNWKISVGI